MERDELGMGHVTWAESIFTFRAFITLQVARHEHIRYCETKQEYNDNLPDNRGLDHVLPVFVDGLENIGRFRLDFSFDGKVEIYADLEAVVSLQNNWHKLDQSTFLDL